MSSHSIFLLGLAFADLAPARLSRWNREVRGRTSICWRWLLWGGYCSSGRLPIWLEFTTWSILGLHAEQEAHFADNDLSDFSPEI